MGEGAPRIPLGVIGGLMEEVTEGVGADPDEGVGAMGFIVGVATTGLGGEAIGLTMVVVGDDEGLAMGVVAVAGLIVGVAIVGAIEGAENGD